MDTGIAPTGFDIPLASAELADVRDMPAVQQPIWDDPVLAARNRRMLSGRPGLVYWREIRGLRLWLAEVAAGRALVVQAGDCAEDPADCTPPRVRRKLAFLDALAERMSAHTALPVLRVGRIAGQFAKPRTNSTERRDGVELPAFRGHLVNAPEWNPLSRRVDATRLLSGYLASRSAMAVLRSRLTAESMRVRPPVWASHEALLLDYELPLVRRDETGRVLLASTHWPWVGDRTRDPEHAHVRMLASIGNPVACKIGPEVEVGQLLSLCGRLDPNRQPGHLTLIARLGVQAVAKRLPELVDAVRAAGHPVIWLCDPLHGNTRFGPGRIKTRWLSDAIEEVAWFCRILEARGGVAGGLHLEATPDPVTECVGGDVPASDLGREYTTLCDPRLNPRQAASLIEAWC